MKKHTEKKKQPLRKLWKENHSLKKKTLFQNPLLKENLTVNRKTLFIKKTLKKHFEKNFIQNKNNFLFKKKKTSFFLKKKTFFLEKTMCFLFLNSSIFLKLWFPEKILPLKNIFFKKKKKKP